MPPVVIAAGIGAAATVGAAAINAGAKKGVSGGVPQDRTDEAWRTSLDNINRQRAFTDDMRGLNWQSKAADMWGQQQGLADQLGMMGRGEGPNPALAQLALNTGQNMQQQAALMGGQRGAGMNPGMIARQMGYQGSNMQQQSVGQAALLRAQQQLAALDALQKQQAFMGQYAGQGTAQTQQALQNLGSMGAQHQGQLLDYDARLRQIASGAQQQNADRLMKGIGGAANAMSGALMPTPQAPQQQAPGTNYTGGGAGVGGNAGFFNKVGQVPEPKESKFLSLYKGLQQGGLVPGKPKVSGDSPKNDVVLARLSPGEVIIPRSKVNDEEKMSAFINQILGMNLGPRNKNAS